MKYSLTTWLLILLMGWVVLGVESGLGIPVASVALSWLIARQLYQVGRVLWLSWVSLWIAGAYNNPVILVWLIVIGGWLVWQESRRFIPTQTGRILIISLCAAGLLGLLAHIQFTAASTFCLVVSVVIVIFSSSWLWRTRVTSFAS